MCETVNPFSARIDCRRQTAKSLFHHRPSFLVVDGGSTGTVSAPSATDSQSCGECPANCRVQRSSPTKVDYSYYDTRPLNQPVPFSSPIGQCVSLGGHGSKLLPTLWGERGSTAYWNYKKTNTPIIDDYCYGEKQYRYTADKSPIKLLYPNPFTTQPWLAPTE
ncbi:hypothetical protein AWENTII_011771 [Aspergillus wentii]